MENKREHKRFDTIELQGKMILANKVEIVDISLGGASLKADRRLDIGREYMMKLGDKEHSIDVRGTVVRSSLLGMEAGADGENVLIYAAGVKFKEGSEDTITAFLNSIEHRIKEDMPAMVERRLNVRFRIISPHEEVLVFPVNFMVKDISLSSMRIQCDQLLERESAIPMELYLSDENHLYFTGKVIACREVEENGQTWFDVEVIYSNLGDVGRATLKEFIDYLATWRSERKEVDLP
jgi:hypothetical protein